METCGAFFLPDGAAFSDCSECSVGYSEKAKLAQKPFWEMTGQRAGRFLSITAPFRVPATSLLNCDLEL